MKANSTAKKFVGNSSWMMLQQIYYMVLSLVIGSLSARYLGPSNYGLINYGASIISFFTIISKLGLDGVIINEMIKKPEEKGSLLGSALVFRLITSVASLFSIMAIIRVLEPDNNVLHVITLLQSFAVILQSYEVFNYWFQLNLRMKYVSIATMIAQTVVGIWRIALLATQSSVYLFALSSSIQFLVCGVVVIACFFKQKDASTKLSFSNKIGVDLVGKSYHFIISGLAITFYMQIDKIMIGKFLTSEAVGIYTAATTVAALWEFVPNALVNSARPLIIEKREKNYEEYIKRFQQLLLGITALSIVVSVGMMIVGRLAIYILYGKNYMDAVIPLSILIWSTGFAMIGTVRSVWIVAEGYNKYSKYYVLIGALVNFVLNYFAIQFWGIVGAAITTLISQAVVAFVSPLFFKKTRGFVKIYFESFAQIPDLIQIIQNWKK